MYWSAPADGSAFAGAQSQDHDLKPTIVLVHGAAAESSSWDAVIARLTKDGYMAIGAANPLRSVAATAFPPIHGFP